MESVQIAEFCFITFQGVERFWKSVLWIPGNFQQIWVYEELFLKILEELTKPSASTLIGEKIISMSCKPRAPDLTEVEYKWTSNIGVVIMKI